MRMMAQNQIGAGREGSARDLGLIIGDDARDEMNAPMQRKYDDVGGLLGAADIVEHRAQVLVAGDRDDLGWNAGLIIESPVGGVNAQRGHAWLAGACLITLVQDRTISEE